MATDLGTVTGYIVLAVVGSSALLSALSHNKNHSRYILWHFITWAQFFQWTALINSQASADYLSFFNSYSKTVKIYQFITYHYYTEVPTRFSELGIQYTYLINNAENLLVIMAISLLIFSIMACTTFKAGDEFRKTVCDSLIIRASLICFMEISMFAFFQMSKFEITTWYGILNSVFAVIFLTAIFAMTAYLPINANYRINVGNKDELEKILTVVEEFKYRTEECRHYYIFFMLQRLVAGLIYVVLAEYCGVQALIIGIFISLTSNFHVVAYTYLTKPFFSWISNYYVIFLELLSLLSVVINAIFSLSSVSASLRNNLAWFLIGCLWAGISVTVVYFSYSICSSENKNINKIIEINIEAPNEATSPAMDESMQNSNVLKRGRLESTETNNGTGEKEDMHGLGRKGRGTGRSNFLKQVRNRIYSEDEEHGMKAGNLKKIGEGAENNHDVRTTNITPELNHQVDFISEEANESYDGDYGNGIKFYGPIARKYLAKK